MKPNQQKSLLFLDSITKSFGGTKALNNASFQLFKGEVHSICGENGAGKSTLIKVLSGAIEPDTGQIKIDGQKLSRLTPADALNHGIATIYQENALFQGLSVAENIFVGAEIKKACGILDRRRMENDAGNILARLGSAIDPKVELSTLGGAQQKIVEIARAFRQSARIIVLDEPSASFGNHEVDLLFRVVREVSRNGTAVIFISHQLEEVFELSDRITVLRDGEMVATYDVGEINEQELINQMVGRDVTQVYHHTAVFSEDVVFRTDNLNGKGVHNVSLRLRKGEIIGIAGLVGSGRTELLNLIFGSLKKQSGDVELFGNKVEISSPGIAVKHHLCLITEDRKIDGLLLGQGYRDNFVLPSLNRYAQPFMNWKAANNESETFAERLSIKWLSLSGAIENLSGGNQQKAILAKWMNTDPDIYLFDEPTRGIDVGAKEEIYIELQKLIEAGKSIILVSSELPEIIGLSDRVYIMKDGSIYDEFTAPGITQNQILESAL